MNKNDVLEAKVIDLSVEGEGIAKVDGMPFFVKDSVPGDEIKFRVTKLKKTYGYGHLDEIIKASPDRVDAQCPHAKRCGGCQLQAMSYEAQLRFKDNKVRNNLKRLGGFSDELLDSVWEPIMGCEKELGYRNKAQFPFGTGADGEPICGFYAQRSHNIIPSTDCALGASVNKEILEIILEWMKQNHVPAYNEVTGKGLVRHALIRYGFATDEILVCLVINGKKLKAEAELVEALKVVPGMTSISININEENTNVILGKECRTLWGLPYISDFIGNVKFEISPQSFYQVNPAQTVRLYQQALDYAQLTGEETVWDLYCGIGTISLFMAQKAKRVIGVEIVPQAIDDARKNAKNNGIENAEFMVGKAEDIAPDLLASKEYGTPDVICVDPPRKGCDERCIETILKAAPKRVVYVSCDSATLARDLKLLCEGGYKLTKVRPVDQFPQTVHVETACLLSRKDPA